MTAALTVGLVLFGKPEHKGPAIWVGSYVWTGDSPQFGGFSGLDIGDDGRTFRAITDRAYTVHGRLIRDDDGRVVGVSASPIVTLRGDDGEPLQPQVRDSEGLSVAPGGGFYVSFERTEEVDYFADENAASTILTYIYKSVIPKLPYNQGLEALALAPDGRLYTIPEYVRIDGRPTPVYMFYDTVWSQPFDLPHVGIHFRVTDADFGPDGMLYVLERDYWPFLGFRSRVRRFTLGDAGLSGGEILFESRAGQHDNLEGLGVWRDTTGQSG